MYTKKVQRSTRMYQTKLRTENETQLKEKTVMKRSATANFNYNDTCSHYQLLHVQLIRKEDQSLYVG
jgi:hypothetical protein